MAHFYGRTQGARGEVTRCGNKTSGLEASAHAGEVIIKGRDVMQYLRLRKQGYKTAWCGEGLICMKKERTSNERTTRTETPR